MKIRMTGKALAASLLATTIVSPVFANEGTIPKGVPRLDRVFVIVMENHGYGQIIGNSNAPFANQYANSANTATNYFAVAHPSLTNYLEIVGGSNFGVHSDNNPNWHNATCTTNLASGTPNTDNPSSPNICPITGEGTDAATPAVDCTNETQCPPGSNAGENNIDGVLSIPAVVNISGKTIADQLVAAGLSWKSYQESLPPTGADGVNFSDGFFTDSSNIPGAIPGAKQSLIKLYGLFEDLSSGRVPNFSLIAPNQCNDQHGRGNAGPQCDFDPNDNGT